MSELQKLISVAITGPSGSYSRQFQASNFLVMGDDDKKQRIVKPQGTGARVDVPRDWIGSRVLVIRLD